MTTAVDELRAAEYVLGTLEAEDRRELEARLAQDADLRSIVQIWEERLAPLAAVDAAAPAAKVWDAIEAAMDAQANAPSLVSRAANDSWVGIMPGVELRLLRAEPLDPVQTFLLRLAPGARVPAHDHAEPEECYMVEGEIEFGGATYAKGDYVLLPARSRHSEITSRNGGTILIRGRIAA